MQKKENKRVLFYGIGKIANYYWKHLDLDSVEIVAAVETNRTRDAWNGVSVLELDEISKLNWDEIWIVNSFCDSVYACLKAGIAKDKIVICSVRVFEDYTEKQDLDIRYMRREAEQYEKYAMTQGAHILTRTIDRPMKVPEACPIETQYGYTLVHDDYIRYSTLLLLAKEIKQRNIPGETAELGVYRGDFAKVLNKEFPDRKLYLFDTFEGFPEQCVKTELENNYTKEDTVFEGRFGDTNIELVLTKMVYPQNVIIKKGFFPSTIPEEEINYAIVSLDCDMYEPILAGLRYFYPRLSKGGYLIIHDYNHEDRWLGIRDAIDLYEKEYCKETNGIVKVPISDAGGSIVLGKS